ncbi:hypothetical protein FJ546_25350 [Mesorhizobium sp. B2-4-19]|uniref:hypothetical protein n=1 Tax=Mesorhizobium sp. B2-4-19 TaxID=2589930 RepID=UPI00112EEB30|nr:hypothetical protein [Mesorhizobium sp. B2-4-19]TPK57671.1 hypothetical protein FJ546_25350 [Mesorhizobium sp. B2-4-19]
MASSIPRHIIGFLGYLNQPHERANEDLAIGYFRALYGDAFQRQKEAKKADGYLAGVFVLELKGQTKNWLSGLFQGLAYQNEGLDFAQVVVAAKNFLAVWQVNDIPESIRIDLAAATGAPNTIGRDFAHRYVDRRNELLRLANWNGADLFTPLFQREPQLLIERISSFEDTLRNGKRVRQRITLRNFSTVLKEMVPYFEPGYAVKAVRAFYSMIYAWDAASTLQISNKAPDQATLGGEAITNLIPAKRVAFKDFVEARYVTLDAQTDYDDYFARYDEALDAVDPQFRRQHGIFFTDLFLSKLAMWIAKQYVPNLGQDYLVIDPACGSGNLVTNWRSPLELRHKVVSEIEPELLFAVEQRMKGDLWHNGRFTVVPRTSENRGLNFLDRSAEEYLLELRTALAEKGHVPDKPLAILCNPPYRSDDDQAADSVSYAVHSSIAAVTGLDASSERYCCFLAQMKLICESARSSGLPGESLLLLFTKSAWLTNRAIFKHIRREMTEVFEDVAGVLVDGSEFFDVRGKWPVAFTVWRYKGHGAKLAGDRSIGVTDLTWLKRSDLINIAWENLPVADEACRLLLQDDRSKLVELGKSRRSIRLWSGQTMTDFKRDRRRPELGQEIVGGLPLNDPRRANKKTYGESSGKFVGFMDDLTPCRIKRSSVGKPWFRLNSQFMDVKKNRCFSGPPSHWGYCAEDLEDAKRLFFWYALARTFVQMPYPMWADAEDLWQPSIPPHLETPIFTCAAAIVFAENECVETYFPANNPIAGAQELFVRNPLTALDPGSFWSEIVRPNLDTTASPAAWELIEAVDEVFATWSKFLGRRRELPIDYEVPYFVDSRPLASTVGLVQIKDYATKNHVEELLSLIKTLQRRLKAAKSELYEIVTVKSGLNYFGPILQPEHLNVPEDTAFERVLSRRLALAGLIVRELHSEPHFGRTKLAKVFYLADKRGELQLETNYAREAAGPLDQRALYNERIGIEALAQKYRVFKPSPQGKMVRYDPLPYIEDVDKLAQKHFGEKLGEIMGVVEACRELTTDQAEIIATIYACWNDLMIRGRQPTDDEIVLDFLERWHPKKARFSDRRLHRALDWIRQRGLVPSGHGDLTSGRRMENAPPVAW